MSTISIETAATTTVEPTAALMKELNKPFTHHNYEKAGHGFLRQQDGKEGANRQASERCWPVVVEFLSSVTR